MRIRIFISSLSLATLMSVSVFAGAGDTRIAEAAMNGDRAVVRTLLNQKVDVNAPQGDGMTALHWAAFKDDVEIAQMLLQAGAAFIPVGFRRALMRMIKGNSASVGRQRAA